MRIDGSKELIAIDSSRRESAESWAGLSRDCERRGTSAPVLAVDAPRLVALVRAGARFERGAMAERPEAQVA